MLTKENRLKKKSDFEKVFKGGKGLKEDFLILRFKKNRLKEPRFGFVVSQKVSKKAVVRNKVKRRLREAVRGLLQRVKNGIDAVIIALPETQAKNFQEVERAMEKLLKKAGVLKQ